jgi:hypothetical protein
VASPGPASAAPSPRAPSPHGTWAEARLRRHSSPLLGPAAGPRATGSTVPSASSAEASPASSAPGPQLPQLLPSPADGAAAAALAPPDDPPDSDPPRRRAADAVSWGGELGALSDGEGGGWGGERPGGQEGDWAPAAWKMWFQRVGPVDQND